MSPCLACLLTLNDMVIYFPGRENVSQEFKSVFEGKRFGSLVDVGGGGRVETNNYDGKRRRV